MVNRRCVEKVCGSEGHPGDVALYHQLLLYISGQIQNNLQQGLPSLLHFYSLTSLNHFFTMIFFISAYIYCCHLHKEGFVYYSEWILEDLRSRIRNMDIQISQCKVTAKERSIHQPCRHSTVSASAYITHWIFSSGSFYFDFIGGYDLTPDTGSFFQVFTVGHPGMRDVNLTASTMEN